ncbi:MAG: hypothetical protein IJV35_00035 [Neisseriaceae bacterium]|nr:hypothetical protein [Neisseriaceae bacterium]
MFAKVSAKRDIINTFRLNCRHYSRFRGGKSGFMAVCVWITFFRQPEKSEQ